MKEIEEEFSENEEMIELTEEEQSEIVGGKKHLIIDHINLGFTVRFQLYASKVVLVIYNQSIDIKIVNITGWKPIDMQVYKKEKEIEIHWENKEKKEKIDLTGGITFMYIDKRDNSMKREFFKFRYC